MSTSLDTLDTLILEFRQALETKDLDVLARINERVRPCVEGTIAGMRAGEISEDAMSERLTTLQTLTAQASSGAGEARAAAEAGLKDVSRNRSAARQYADIGARGPR